MSSRTGSSTPSGPSPEAPGAAGSPAARLEEVLERVREIPAGFVRTYGDVSPGAPRFAGLVLSQVDEPDLPWWRVVRADGSLTQGARQRQLLFAEGVPFRGQRVEMTVARIAAEQAAEAASPSRGTPPRSTPG